jgi:hypothetical protein
LRQARLPARPAALEKAATGRWRHDRLAAKANLEEAAMGEELERDEVISAESERELFVTWTGPYAWPGFERDGLTALPNHGGVYLQTFEREDEFLIYTAGEAGNFRKRFGQHATKFRSGDYTVLDVDQAQAGVRSEIWHGWGWTPEKKAEFERRQDEIRAAAARELAAMRIFVSNDLTQRERRRLEGAIIRRLYADGAPLPDRGMFAHRAFDHEAPIAVVNVCAGKLLGLPERMLIEGPRPRIRGRERRPT